MIIIANFIGYIQAKSMSTYYENGEVRSDEVPGIQTLIKRLFIGQKVLRPSVVGSPLDFKIPFKEIKLSVGSDITISVWECCKEHVDKYVLLAPGYNRTKADLLLEASFFWKLGFDCFILDFRGVGDSNQSYSTAGYFEAEDIVALNKYIEKKKKYTKKILFGHSMGAVAILRAMANYGVQGDGVIIEATYLSLSKTIRSRLKKNHIPSWPLSGFILLWLKRLKNIPNMNIKTYSKEIGAPTLVLHGELDKKAEFRHAKELFNSFLSDKKKLVAFPNTAHEAYFIKNKEPWAQAVKEFLGQI